MALEDWRQKPLIFVDDIELPQLSESDLHHFERVRRVSEGTPITISDGAGAWRSALFGPTPHVDGPVHVEPEPATPSIVGFAPVKGDRPELVVQKLTELGVDVILPLQTARSVVRWDAKRAAKQLVKFQTIAREASMQSRRVRIPDIRPLASLDDAVATLGARVVLAEPGEPALDPAADRVVFIGPEGGWDDHERSQYDCRGLPGGILRAETAAIVAGVLLAAADL